MYSIKVKFLSAQYACSYINSKKLEKKKIKGKIIKILSLLEGSGYREET